MRNYEMVLQALKSGKAMTMADLKAELPGLEWWNMHKYVARAKYLAGAEIELMKAGAVIKPRRLRRCDWSMRTSSSRGSLRPRRVGRCSARPIRRRRRRARRS
jgi:hypothetical protein